MRGDYNKKRAEEEMLKAKLNLNCAEKQLELIEYEYLERQETYGEHIRTR